jgi:hypothetical protein
MINPKAQSSTTFNFSDLKDKRTISDETIIEL